MDLIKLLSPIYYPYWQRRLTVLAYHRIVSDEEFAASGAKIAVSTGVSEFERQMQFIKAHFSPITIEALQQWLQGKGDLPKRPALITFDDGYQDIYLHAMPVLEQLNIPATVFLATDYMGSSRMFQWDIATYCFESTSLISADLPLLGKTTWENPVQRNQVLKQWLAASKQCQDVQRQAATQELVRVLQVDLPADNQTGTAFLTWEQVRKLIIRGLSFGSHTCHHPILSKIPLEQVADEVHQSKDKIEQETEREVLSFAYPNGLVADFNAEVIGVLKQAGYQCAFTLLAGPCLLEEVKNEPLQIKRITITAKDSYWRFILKLTGLVRLKRHFKA